MTRVSLTRDVCCARPCMWVGPWVARDGPGGAKPPAEPQGPLPPAATALQHRRAGAAPATRNQQQQPQASDELAERTRIVVRVCGVPRLVWPRRRWPCRLQEASAPAVTTAAASNNIDSHSYAPGGAVCVRARFVGGGCASSASAPPRACSRVICRARASKAGRLCCAAARRRPA
eukprot:scaffold584_cov343-Prasinococcus_capsulatus_cf.AAC.2